MDEEKTLIRFYNTNGGVCFEETLEGVDDREVLKMVGMMELAKIKILLSIDKEYRENEE